jgi:predicted RNase H-like nuclease (RuvC/YqgF family)
MDHESYADLEAVLAKVKKIQRLVENYEVLSSHGRPLQWSVIEVRDLLENCPRENIAEIVIMLVLGGTELDDLENEVQLLNDEIRSLESELEQDMLVIDNLHEEKARLEKELRQARGKAS